MFSSLSREFHDQRRRVLSPSYSHMAVYSARVQSIIRQRVETLMKFLDRQTIESSRPSNSSGPLIVRNILRAFTVDVFTAFAFSEDVATNHMARLGSGVNSMVDLQLDDLELWYEDTREGLFFFYREPEFRWARSILARKGESLYARFEGYLTVLLFKYQAMHSEQASKLRKKETDSECQSTPKRTHLEQEQYTDRCVYASLLTWKNPTTGRGLTWLEGASEMMDHLGKQPPPVKTSRRAHLHARLIFPESVKNEKRLN